MKATKHPATGDDPALAWSHGLRVEVGGAGTLAQAGWSTDMRLIVRACASGEQSGQTRRAPDWEYGVFVTNTGAGQVQFLDARHRTQAHVEDRVKQFKACGARNLPSIDYDRNSAWLQLAALATSLTAWLRHVALEGVLAKASTKNAALSPLLCTGHLLP